MITKTAQPPYWPKIKQGLQTLGLNSGIMAMLNANKCVWDPSAPPDTPDAVAYVSNRPEDVNNDGKIDKIHFILDKFPPNVSDEDMPGLIAQVAKDLVHEYGHIEDYDPEKRECRGGEAAAEAAVRAAEGMINQKLQLAASKNTTNKKIGTDNANKTALSGELKVKKELVKLANHLDRLGHRDLADKLDEILKSAFQDYNFDSGEPSIEDEIALEEEDEDLRPPREEVLSETSGDAVDAVWATESVSDRINKLAKLMSGEFTTNASGSFNR